MGDPWKDWKLVTISGKSKRGGGPRYPSGAINTEDCAYGYEFDVKLCACAKKVACEIFCSEPYYLDPVSKCKCIGPGTFLELYNHGKDKLCNETDYWFKHNFKGGKDQKVSLINDITHGQVLDFVSKEEHEETNKW